MGPRATVVEVGGPRVTVVEVGGPRATVVALKALCPSPLPCTRWTHELGKQVCLTTGLFSSSVGLNSRFISRGSHGGSSKLHLPGHCAQGQRSVQPPS